MIRQLLDRRVPHFVGLYLVGCWGFLEFLDWAVTRYLLSPALIDFVLVLLLLLLPAVGVIAWRHGAPGADQWTRSDAIAIGVNVLVAAVVLFVAFRGAELGAMTTVKLLQDAEGNTVERVVPKASFRRSLLVFDLENETGDADLEWMEFGIVLALGMDLAQDVFVTTASADDPTVREFLAQRGHEPGGDVPLSLKREAAELRGLEYFLAGSLRRDGGSTSVQTRLHRTSSGRVVASHEYPLTDPRDVADRISLDLRRDLEIPEGHIEQSLDLPAAEMLTESPDAFRLISDGHRRLMRENEPAAAKALAERALAIDSTATMAHLLLANSVLFVGDQAAAASALEDAMEHDYRLPERMRLGLQVQNAYFFEGEPETALRMGRYWTEVYPEDVEARRLLGSMNMAMGDREGSIRQFRALLSIDSTDVAATGTLASLLVAQAEYDSAIALYERLRDRRPNDVDVRLSLADAQETAGRFEAARETLEEAGVVAPRDADVPRQLAQLDLRTGDFDGARKHLEEGRELEGTAVERERRHALEESLYYQMGRFDRLEQAYRGRLAALAELRPLLGVVSSIGDSEFLLYAAEFGRGEAALSQIDSLRVLVQPPWTYLLDFPAIRTHLATGDLEKARAALEGIRGWIDYAGAAEQRLAIVAWAGGEIARLEDGDCERAVEEFDRAVEANPNNGLFRAARLACSRELERWRDAEADAGVLLERYPGRPTYRMEIARFEAARGRSERAVEHLEAALVAWSEADAEYRPAREARALLESLRG